jgi:hypothetical protein
MRILFGYPHAPQFLKYLGNKKREYASAKIALNYAKQVNVNSFYVKGER